MNERIKAQDAADVLARMARGEVCRPESGAMRFGDDWTGIFIRGDDALMRRLPALLRNDPAFLRFGSLIAFARLLAECDETGPDGEASKLIDFYEQRAESAAAKAPAQ